VDFALAQNLVVRGTLFVHKNIHKGTQKTPDGNTLNKRDHILTDATHKSNLLDVKVFIGVTADLDHCLLGCII
jgi:hypothetical protein